MLCRLLVFSYNAVSLSPDRLFLAADIYYNGAYSGVISATVIEAIDTFLSNIDFDGIIRVSKLIDAIQSVPGVTDVAINDLAMRPIPQFSDPKHISFRVTTHYLLSIQPQRVTLFRRIQPEKHS